jgi:hypothetical protein
MPERCCVVGKSTGVNSPWSSSVSTVPAAPTIHQRSPMRVAALRSAPVGWRPFQRQPVRPAIAGTAAETAPAPAASTPRTCKE